MLPTLKEFASDKTYAKCNFREINGKFVSKASPFPAKPTGAWWRDLGVESCAWWSLVISPAGTWVSWAVSHLSRKRGSSSADKVLYQKKAVLDWKPWQFGDHEFVNTLKKKYFHKQEKNLKAVFTYSKKRGEKKKKHNQHGLKVPRKENYTEEN